MSGGMALLYSGLGELKQDQGDRQPA